MSIQAAARLPRPRTEGWAELLSEGRAPVLALLLLGCWVVAADSMVIATIMPSVGASLDGFAWFGWSASLFLTGLVVAAASSSWLAGRIGLRAALMLSGGGFTAGCTLSAAGSGIGLFLAGRAVQGCAAGWVSGLIYVALATLFPSRHLPRVFALLTSVWAIATFAGPLLGGIFADVGAWRGVFWLFAGQGLLFTAASFVLIPAGAAGRDGGTLPVRSLLLLTVSIGALSSAGILSNLTVAALLASAGAALLAVAVAGDRRSPNGVLPRRSTDPAFPLGAAYLTYFCSTAAGTSFALYAPTMLQYRAGMSALEAGYLVAIEAVAWTAASLSVSGAGEAWRSRLIVVGPAAILAGTISNTLLIHGGNLPAIAVGGAALGAGFGLCYAFISQRVMAAFDDANRARGSSAISAARNSGGALGAAVAAIAANAAGFGEGLGEGNAAWVAWGAFGSGIPFALGALFFAIRLAKAPSREREAGPRQPGPTKAAKRRERKGRCSFSCTARHN
jgi:MFS family permease